MATIEILHAEEIGSTDGGSYVLLTMFTAEGTYRVFFGEVISSGVFRVPAVQLREALEPFAFLHRGASELDFTTSCLLNLFPFDGTLGFHCARSVPPFGDTIHGQLIEIL